MKTNPPLPLSLWRYKNGNEYTVLFITNIAHTAKKHPPQVVYRGVNGHRWSMPLSSWHRNMTLIGGDGEDSPEETPYTYDAEAERVFNEGAGLTTEITHEIIFALSE